MAGKRIRGSWKDDVWGGDPFELSYGEARWQIHIRIVPQKWQPLRLLLQQGRLRLLYLQHATDRVAWVAADRRPQAVSFDGSRQGAKEEDFRCSEKLVRQHWHGITAEGHGERRSRARTLQAPGSLGDQDWGYVEQPADHTFDPGVADGVYRRRGNESRWSWIRGESSRP